MSNLLEAQMANRQNFEVALKKFFKLEFDATSSEA